MHIKLRCAPVRTGRNAQIKKMKWWSAKCGMELSEDDTVLSGDKTALGHTVNPQRFSLRFRAVTNGCGSFWIGLGSSSIDSSQTSQGGHLINFNGGSVKTEGSSKKGALRPSPKQPRHVVT